MYAPLSNLRVCKRIYSCSQPDSAVCRYSIFTFGKMYLAKSHLSILRSISVGRSQSQQVFRRLPLMTLNVPMCRHDIRNIEVAK